jgi:hypothetical protein
VKDAAGRVHQEGKIGSTRRELDRWIRTLPQPRTIAMEATIFTGWIYDHLLPIVGGMITSTIHVQILVPVFFMLIKRRALRNGTVRTAGATPTVT